MSLTNSSKHPEPPPGSEYELPWKHPRKGDIHIPVYRAEDGNDYLIMKSAVDYLGLSKTMTEEIILDLEAEGKLQRYKFVGRAIYVRRDDLDKIREEIRTPKVVQRPVAEKKKSQQD